MTEESTLDAFVSEPDASDEETADRATESAADVDTAGGHGVEPVAVTSSWRGKRDACEACAEPAGRLWDDDGARVCASCKPWTSPGGV